MLLSNKGVGVAANAKEASGLSDKDCKNAATNSKNNSKNTSTTLSPPSIVTTTAEPIGSTANRCTELVCTRTRIAADIHFVVLKVRNHGCSIKKAMLFAGFTAEESNHRALQRRVIRLTAKLTTAPPPN